MRDLIIIGGGPAGLAAAYAAYEKGVRDILIIERDAKLGGILNQCIHNGFGLHRFGEELSGPEYAGRYIAMLKDTGVEVYSDTMVLELRPDRTVCAVSAARGYVELQAKAIVLAMGCRERTRGAISIPGKRPSGVFTAGAAQRYLNMEGWLCGKRVVILGSGDIGLIMARRMTLEGAKVLACVEVMPYSGGLNRNIVQCLHDFDIPLYLSHTVTDIRGDKRLTGVTVMKVDDRRMPIPGTEMDFDCDTLLLSVGLIPENELTRQAGITISKTNGPVVFDNMETSLPGVFACGNVVHVHDLVDFVSEEAARAGSAAADRIFGKLPGESAVSVLTGNAVSYTVPQYIRDSENEKAVSVSFRVNKVMENVTIEVQGKEKTLCSYKRAHMAPGEMEKIVIPRVLLKNETAVTVAIKE
ncbi:MAG: FAD-dependent oxidoreductase [Clostridia bacterium]|nr:FAD-dependent oxidoreductase [Clostridia bacterium]